MFTKSASDFAPVEAQEKFSDYDKENEINLKDSRSNSYERLGNNKKNSNNSDYKIQYNDSIDEIKRKKNFIF